ncbi:uncharacterized protein LOC128340456 isoform X2 [Hemicordylus capensis]|uniref:uncharacterized protein LOC128340456 isoform X2 n=1 Tax=Hemicordylus capensis TaxID=884348 RepID=UPI0023042E50|nr:uncharacterized protein LOC128340456 isoform X2 [Hemicordylus capensis]
MELWCRPLLAINCGLMPAGNSSGLFPLQSCPSTPLIPSAPTPPPPFPRPYEYPEDDWVQPIYPSPPPPQPQVIPQPQLHPIPNVPDVQRAPSPGRGAGIGLVDLGTTPLQRLRKDLEALDLAIVPSNSGTVSLTNPKTSPVAWHTRSKSSSRVPILAPLRETLTATGEQTLVHVPFSSADLMNWKLQTKSLREDLVACSSLFESVFATHKPIWADVQQMAGSLLTAEERRLLLQKATQLAANMGARQTPVATTADLYPLQDPNWDPNTDAGRAALDTFCQLFLEALNTCVPRHTNRNRLHQTFQGPNESPGDFLERLEKCLCQFTSLDLKSPEAEHILRAAFLAQSAQDIRKRLNKLDAPLTMALDSLVEAAYRVYTQRANPDPESEREKEKEKEEEREKEKEKKESEKEKERERERTGGSKPHILYAGR